MAAAAALLHWLPLGSVITLRVDNQLNLLELRGPNSIWKSKTLWGVHRSSPRKRDLLRSNFARNHIPMTAMWFSFQFLKIIPYIYGAVRN